MSEFPQTVEHNIKKHTTISPGKKKHESEMSVDGATKFVHRHIVYKLS